MFSWWIVNPQVKIYYRIAEVPGFEEETRFIFLSLVSWVPKKILHIADISEKLYNLVIEGGRGGFISKPPPPTEKLKLLFSFQGV